MKLFCILQDTLGACTAYFASTYWVDQWATHLLWVHVKRVLYSNAMCLMSAVLVWRKMSYIQLWWKDS